MKSRSIRVAARCVGSKGTLELRSCCGECDTLGVYVRHIGLCHLGQRCSHSWVRGSCDMRPQRCYGHFASGSEACGEPSCVWQEHQPVLQHHRSGSSCCVTNAAMCCLTHDPTVASGFAAWADVTHELERGFWPSYNIPYFKVRACDAREMMSEMYECSTWPPTHSVKPLSSPCPTHPSYPTLVA